MKKFTLLFLGNALFFSAFAQLSDITKPLVQDNLTAPQLSLTVAEGDTLWTTGGTTGLNFSQVYLQNWAAGGESSLAVNGLFNWYAN